MKFVRLMPAAVAALSLLASPLAALAQDSASSPKGGTVKGAVVGGVAGHMMAKGGCPGGPGDARPCPPVDATSRTIDAEEPVTQRGGPPRR